MLGDEAAFQQFKEVQQGYENPWSNNWLGQNGKGNQSDTSDLIVLDLVVDNVVLLEGGQ
jgi:hypothetical protein